MSEVEFVTEEYNRRWNESEDQHQEQYIPEKYQLGIIADYLQSQDIVFTTEARVFSYPIDILGVDDGDTVAVEMKSRNVSRGIEQTLRDADIVDYSYLALWEKSISEELVEEVIDLPIGLMSVDEKVQVISEPEMVTQQLCRKKSIVQKVIDDVRDNSSVQER